MGVVARNIYIFVVLVILYVLAVVPSWVGTSPGLWCFFLSALGVVDDGEASKQHRCDGEAIMGALSGFASTNELQVVLISTST